MSVIREKPRNDQRVCGHGRRTYAVLACTDGSLQIRNTCRDCGARSNDPQPQHLHPNWKTYPRIVPANGQPIKVRGKVEYESYLASPEWAERRTYYLAKALHRCQLCNREGGPGGRGLHAHHRTYERLGAELDADITVLCKDCHKRHHEILSEEAA